MEKQENRWSEYEKEKGKSKDTKNRAEGGEVGKWRDKGERGLPWADTGLHKCDAAPGTKLKQICYNNKKKEMEQDQSIKCTADFHWNCDVIITVCLVFSST